MAAPRSDVERVLERVLGFRRDEGDHHRFRLEIDGNLVAITKTSHSHTTISDSLLAEMARQLHIPSRFFRDLIAGRRNRADYLERRSTKSCGCMVGWLGLPHEDVEVVDGGGAAQIEEVLALADVARVASLPVADMGQGVLDSGTFAELGAPGWSLLALAELLEQALGPRGRPGGS